MKLFRSILIALVAFLFASVSLQAAPYDPPTWRDSTWDYRSEDPSDSTRELSVAKSIGVASTVLIAYGAAYWLVFKKGWWDEEGTEVEAWGYWDDFPIDLRAHSIGGLGSVGALSLYLSLKGRYEDDVRVADAVDQLREEICR